MSFIDADSAKMADDSQLNRQQNEAVVSQQKTEDPSSKGVCVLSNIILCLYMTDVYMYIVH